MKTMIIKQVSLFLVTAFFLTTQNISAQNEKLTRQERKEVRKAQMEANFYILDSLLNSRTFVLKADYLRSSDGVLTPVVSYLNFVKVDGDEGVLQTGSNSDLGYNGVGGATAEGNIGGWEVSKDSKKLTHTIRFNLITNMGSYDVLMFIGADNRASATIRGLSRGWLTWQGELFTIKNSRVFKGQETI